jgi:uncharacterized membrane protein
MVQIDKINSRTDYRLILSPNCSINWRHLLVFYIFICFVALVVALFFVLQGIWMVLPFSGLEMLVLGLALHVVFRKTQKREVITIGSVSVRIEKGQYSPDQCWEFDKSWIRLHDELTSGYKPRRKLELGSHGNYVEVGEFLSGLEKDALAFQLKGCIICA